jgi:hypothetical protein
MSSPSIRAMTGPRRPDALVQASETRERPSTKGRIRSSRSAHAEPLHGTIGGPVVEDDELHAFHVCARIERTAGSRVPARFGPA